MTGFTSYSYQKVWAFTIAQESTESVATTRNEVEQAGIWILLDKKNTQPLHNATFPSERQYVVWRFAFKTTGSDFTSDRRQARKFPSWSGVSQSQAMESRLGRDTPTRRTSQADMLDLIGLDHLFDRVGFLADVCSTETKCAADLTYPFLSVRQKTAGSPSMTVTVSPLPTNA